MSEWAAKRFWTTVKVISLTSGYEITLDGRQVKTPAKNALVVPTKALANAIAGEWDAQVETIDPLTMPMTRSANAAIDKVRPQHAEVADLIAAYGENDLLCYRATGPETLIARQAQEWDPILQWARDALGVTLQTTHGVMNVDQPANSVEILKSLVHDQTEFQLAALHDLVSLTGSLIMGLAVQRDAFPTDGLWQASRLDERWQIEQWGDDEEALIAAVKKESAFKDSVKFFSLLF